MEYYESILSSYCTMNPRKKPRECVSRISVSLPPNVSRNLDGLVAARGFDNRSQAVANIINESLIEYQRDSGHGVMSGTITLFYNQRQHGLLGRLATLKRRSLDEVIGSLQIQLEADHILEVIVVQGPVKTLRKIADDLTACKGVQAGKLALTASLIPQVHPLK